MRTAISAEATRKIPGAKLPVIPKNITERDCIENALYENAFMRNLSKDQFSQVWTKLCLANKSSPNLTVAITPARRLAAENIILSYDPSDHVTPFIRVFTYHWSIGFLN